jgi:hypothetical protein
MTDAKFCDIHPDQATSLIRVQSGQRSFYTLQLGYDLVEKNAEGKKTRWTVQSKPMHVCAKCAMEMILKRAQALGVEPEWQDAWRLVKGNDGKYKRLVKGVEEAEEQVSA